MGPCTSFVELLDHAHGVAFKGCRLLLKSATPTRSPCPGISSILIKPIDIRLTNKKLLKRCLSGVFQNEESLNNCIWHICPKDSFCGKDTVETAVYMAVGVFNNDLHCTIVLKLLQCDVGCYAVQGLEEIDNVRLYHPARKGSDKEEKARKCQRAVRT